MITNDRKNVILTPEQASQLSEWSARLSIIQDEIKKSEKTRLALEAEIETKNKHKKNLEEDITTLTAQAASLEKRKTDLGAEITHSLTVLETYRTETATHTNELRDLKAEHSTAEKKLQTQETHLAKKITDIAQQEEALKEKKLLVEKAQEAFLKATETITWK